MTSRPAPHCPKCREIKLKVRTLSDHTTQMDICPGCKGGWFDGEELAAVLSCALEELDIPKDAEPTNCVCPKCFVPLARSDYPDTSVEVDVCNECGGIWLDRGEFREINHQRAEFQDRLKFYDEFPRPKTLKQAVVRFIDRMVVRYADIR
jgi:Zn-finger nucleic acid-binding protein